MELEAGWQTIDTAPNDGTPILVWRTCRWGGSQLRRQEIRHRILARMAEPRTVQVDVGQPQFIGLFANALDALATATDRLPRRTPPGRR